MATRETQKSILDKAIELFNEHGSSNISANRIAAECGISKGNLYYHFRNKEAIVATIYDRMAAEIRDEWSDDLADPTANHMREMFERQLSMIWRHRFFYREMMALLAADDALRLRFSEDRRQRSEMVLDFFKALIENDVLLGPNNPKTLRSLVTLSWILSDNWINYIAVDRRDIYPDFIRDGYELIIDLFRPYLSPATLTVLQRQQQQPDTAGPPATPRMVCDH